MTPEQQKHLDGLVARFTVSVRDKYQRGQAEHGGNIWDKAGMLREAKMEVLDQWVYLDTIEQQIRGRDPKLAAFLLGCRVQGDGDGGEPVA